MNNTPNPSRGESPTMPPGPADTKANAYARRLAALEAARPLTPGHSGLLRALGEAWQDLKKAKP